MSSLEINPKHFFEELHSPKDSQTLLKKLLDLSNDKSHHLIEFIVFLFKNNLLRSLEQFYLCFIVCLLHHQFEYPNHLHLVISVLID